MDRIQNEGGGSAAAAPGQAIASNGGKGGSGEISHLFTTLLVAQIKNQNPLEPSDPSEFVNQLTQMSQMETLQKLSEQGAANAGMLSSLQMLSLGAQVGTTVQARVEQLRLDGQALQTHFSLASAASPATLVLTAADGSERRVDLGARGAGVQSYRLDPAALGLAAGNYQVRIENESRQSTALEVAAELRSVRLSGEGGALLQLGGLGEISPAAITQFMGRATAPLHS